MMTKKLYHLPSICFAAALLAMWFPTRSSAEDAVKLTAENVRVTSLDSVTVDSPDNSKIGIVETLSKSGHVILLVKMDIKAEWTEKIRRVSISGRKMSLVGKDDAALPVFGRLYDGVFYDGPPSLSIKRPFKWHDENPAAAFNVAFLVPSGSGPFTLKVGDALSVPITLPANSTQEPHISSKMSVKVISAKLVDRLSLQAALYVGKDKLATDIAHSGGSFLEVTFDLTPNDFNRSLRDKFYWNTSWFGVRYDGKHHSHTVGEAHMKGLSQNVSHNTAIVNGKGSTSTSTFYFPATPDAKTFELLCRMRVVAKGTISK